MTLRFPRNQAPTRADLPVRTDFADSMTDPKTRAAILEQRDRIAIAPEAIARAIAFAIDEPADVDVNEIVVRPTAQG